MASIVNFGTQQYSGFDPRTLPGCCLWLDAADSDTVVVSGFAVSQWSDKSALANHATGTATYSRNAQNGKNTISFFLTTDLLTIGTPANLPSGTADYSAFVVAIYPLGVGGSDTLFRWGGTTSGTTFQLYMVSQTLYQDYSGAGVSSTPHWLSAFVFSGVATQPSASPYVNGTAFSTTTPYAYDFGTPTVGEIGTAVSAAWQICEIILYTRALSTVERAQVEGYLAWKWGLQSQFPVAHPFKTAPPAMRLFQPVDLPECLFWVDPADRSTVTTTGSQLERILSKGSQQGLYGSNQQASGDGFPDGPWSSYPPPGVTYYGVSNFTTSSDPTIQFTQTIGSGSGTPYGNGFNGSYLDVPNLEFTSQARSWFFVWAPTTGGVDNYDQLFATTSRNTPADARVRGFTDYSTHSLFAYPYNYAGSEVLAMQGAPPYTGAMATTGRPYLFSLRHNVSSTTEPNYGSIDGNVQPLIVDQSLVNGYYVGTDEHILGIGQAYTREFLLGDFVYFDRALRNDEIARMEGFLAWKWGMQGYLPSTHAFKTVLPSTPLFTPRMLSGIVVWSDAAIYAGQSTGYSPATWTNLGSQGTVNTTGTLVAEALNGLPVMQYTTTQTWGTTNVISLAAYSLFFVTRQSGATQQSVLRSTTNNQHYGYVGGVKDALVIDGDPSLTGGVSDTAWDLYAHTRTAGGSYLFRRYGTPLYGGATSTANGMTGLAINTLTPSDCQVAEILLISSVLSRSQYQQVEGYLAWKWGLHSNLSSDHPYARIRP